MIQDLRGILHYVPQFRGKIFVVTFDGAAVADPNFANLLLDVAVLHNLGIRVVIVHGAGQQIRKLAEKRKAALSNDDGSGPTDAATMEIAIDAVGRITTSVMQGLTAVGLRSAQLNALIAHRAGVLKGVDQVYTGRVDRVHGESFHSVLGAEIVPVVTPVAYDGRGNTLRVNSDHLAAEIAIALGANKVIYVTDMAEIGAFGLDAPQHLAVAEARALAGQNAEAPRGLLSKLEHGARACMDGVPRAHIIDSHHPEAILAEVFDNIGIGVMIHADEYQAVRPAEEPDIASIMALLRQSIEDEALAHRTQQDLLARLGDYFLLEVDKNIIGTVAVHQHAADGGGISAELACLYVRRSHENQGHGRRLVRFAELKARGLGAKQLFAITTQADQFFSDKCGFRETGAEELPPARREALERSGRRSKVFLKDL